MKKDFWKAEVLHYLGTKDWGLVTDIKDIGLVLFFYKLLIDHNWIGPLKRQKIEPDQYLGHRNLIHSYNNTYIIMLPWIYLFRVEKRQCTVKTTDGRWCHFPFTYRGKVYHKCTTKDHHRRWCSTSAKYIFQNNFGRWGNCQGNKRNVINCYPIFYWLLLALYFIIFNLYYVSLFFR